MQRETALRGRTFVYTRKPIGEEAVGYWLLAREGNEEERARAAGAVNPQAIEDH